MISWAQGHIKKIKRTLRGVTRSIRSVKARKSKPNKIDRGDDTLNNDIDCDSVYADEGNED